MMSKKIIIGFGIFFFLLGLINLTLLPIFNDEAIYIDWGQKMILAGDFFSFLSDGKPPFLMWVFGFFANLFSDPLLGGRTVSLIFGAFSAFGIYKIAKEYFSVKTSFLSVFFYILSPAILFFNRQALMESAVACLGIWSFYFLKKSIDERKLKYSLALGFIWGIGLFTKLSFLVFIISSFIIFPLFSREKIEKSINYLILSFFCALIILLPLFIQPEFMKIIQTNNRYTLTITELIKFPYQIWWQNFKSVIEVLFFQNIGLLIIPLFLGIYHFIKNNKNRDVVIWYLTGIFIYIFTSKSANPRYLLPFLPLGIIISSDFLLKIKKNLSLLIIVPSFIWFTYLDALLIFSPITFFNTLGKISAYSQKSIYLGTFTSGYGVKNAVDYVVENAKGKEVIVGVRLDAGNPENSVFVYLRKYPNIKVTYLDSKIFEKLPTDYFPSNYPVYFITRENQLAGLDNLLVEKVRFVKPDGTSAIVVYQVKTKIRGIEITQ